MKQWLAADAAQTILYHLIRLYGRTFDLRVENEHPWLTHCSSQRGRVLLCCFHQQFFAAIRHFKNYQPLHPGLMISRSRDGDIIAGVARRSGWHPVRGSSSRGGTEALRAMIDHLRKFRLGAHIVDGPRGPARIVKPGAIRLAAGAGAVIVPFYVATNRGWYFNSWDRFFVPKPGARVILRYGDPIEPGKINAPEHFEQQRHELEKTMNRESARLDQQLRTGA